MSRRARLDPAGRQDATTANDSEPKSIRGATKNERHELDDQPETGLAERLSAAPRPVPPTAPSTLDKLAKFATIGVFLLLSIGFLYLARDVLLPVSIAFLFALVLSPVVRGLARRGIPAAASATAIVVVMLVGFTAIGFLLVEPIRAIVADAPRIAWEIQEKFAVLRGPIEAIGRATSRITEIVTPTGAERVMVQDGAGLPLGYLATDAGQRLAAMGLSLVLLLFVLASGDLFQEKLIKVLPTLSDRKRALRIARDIEHEVSRYLFTVTFINIGLGAAVGAAFWLLGMPSPILWALFAALANFLPYIGPAIVAIVSFGIAVVAFDTLGQALLAPLAFLMLTVLEGQILTPMIVGQRHALNAVVILISIAFWGWIWGILGALIAVPMLVTVKVFADHIEPFRPIGEFLSARADPVSANDDGEGQ
jgi:predicted PurR-regulated permease PerM